MGISLEVFVSQFDVHAVIQQGQVAELFFDACSDRLLDSASSVQNPLDGGGLTTATPDAPQCLLEVGGRPAGAYECGARESTVEIVQANAHTTGLEVGDDDPGLVGLKRCDVALPILCGLVAPDDGDNLVSKRLLQGVEAVVEVDANKNAAAFGERILGEFDE